MKTYRWSSLAALAVATILGTANISRAQDEKGKSGGNPPAKRDVETLLTEQRLKRMNTELALTDEQKTKLRPIILEEVKKFRALRENLDLTEQDRIKIEKEIQAANKEKYKTILTSEQFGKWEESTKKKPRKPSAQ